MDIITALVLHPMKLFFKRGLYPPVLRTGAQFFVATIFLSCGVGESCGVMFSSRTRQNFFAENLWESIRRGSKVLGEMINGMLPMSLGRQLYFYTSLRDFCRDVFRVLQKVVWTTTYSTIGNSEWCKSAVCGLKEKARTRVGIFTHAST